MEFERQQGVYLSFLRERGIDIEYYSVRALEESKERDYYYKVSIRGCTQDQFTDKNNNIALTHAINKAFQILNEGINLQLNTLND